MQTRIVLQHSTSAHGGTSIGFGDGLNKIIDCLLSLFTLFAVPLMCLVTISTTKSSGHDPRHGSYYVSTVWPMLVWGRLFLSTPVTPVGSHFGSNLCYDIKFQVTPSRLVSLVKCCSEQFGTNLPLFSAVDIP